MSYDQMREFFGIAGLLIFIALFAAVLIYTFWPGNRKRFDHASRIPLDDDEQPPPGEAGPGSASEKPKQDAHTSRGDDGRA
jgi:cytochrome c oxidase cbb3-type subunit 4